MTSFRRAAGVCAAAMLAAAGLLTVSSSAQAAEHPSASAQPQVTKDSGTKADCPDGALCLWDGPDYDGDFYKYTGTGDYELPKEFRNRAGSYVNYTGQCVKGWDWVTGFDYGVLLVDNTVGPMSGYSHEAGGTWDNRLDQVDIGGCP